MREYKFFPLIWFMVLMTSLHFLLLVSRTLHPTPSGTVLISSAEQVHDVTGEVRNFTEHEILSQTEDGRKYFNSSTLKWILALIIVPLSHSITLITASDEPSGITTYRLFVRKFSPPESDDDVLLS